MIIIAKYCPAGSTSEQPCTAGSYCSDSSTIQQCPAGSYCPSGSTAATACTSGSYCAAGSSSQGSLCLAGYYCSTAATQVACAISMSIDFFLILLVFYFVAFSFS